MSNNTFNALLAQQIKRRNVLKIGLGGLLSAAIPLPLSATSLLRDAESLIGFKSVPIADLLDEVVVPEGYQAKVFFRWGDPISGGPEFKLDASNSAADQALQAGMHHDGMAFFPLPAASADAKRGLLAMNHEYLDLQLMHPDGSFLDSPETFSEEKVRKEQNAHGVSIIEVMDTDSGWQIVRPSTYARRITAQTPMQISGPAAGHHLMQTIADPQGLTVLGTLNNCASGATPWGTYLTCEENFHYYFSLADKQFGSAHQQQRWADYELGYSYYGWHQFAARFDMAAVPNEPNRFGWAVEIDPYHPEAMPIKRTALGRFSHENVAYKIANDGRVAFYSGDDSRFEYIYKFITRDAWDGSQGAHHGQLLDEGVLYVARFDENNRGEWLPLIFGENGLTQANGFSDQADVLIHARAAADWLGATKMDRPEWITTHPETGDVFVSLTNNTDRDESGEAAADAANPRNQNAFGHLLRFSEKDAADTQFDWEVFILAGGTAQQSTIKGDIFANPDGLKIDPRGVLWVQTDMSTSVLYDGFFKQFGTNQMLAVNPQTGESKRFLTGPIGCEVTGLCFAPDMKTMWINIQHPGETPSVLADKGIQTSPQTPNTVSNWPDHQANGRPRSATVMITKDDGGVIGT